MGRLFLNEEAYDALYELIAQDGEILPVSFEGASADEHGMRKDGAIFNPLKIAEDFDALDTKLSMKNEWEDLVSLEFNEKRLNDVGITLFRSSFEGFTGIFCTEAFKSACEAASLKGITFTPDLANIFPEDPSAQCDTILSYIKSQFKKLM